MSTKHVPALFLTLLVLGAAYTFIGTAGAETTARLYVDPPSVTVPNIGDIFTVNINIADISKLAGWQVQLFYDARVVNAIATAEGPFLRTAGNPFFLAPHGGFNNTYNATHGEVFLLDAILGGTPGASGSGTLANITFRALAAGSSVLSISRDPDFTKLLDNTVGNPQRIPYSSEDGFVSLIANDVAVTNIHLSKNIVNDTQVTINVTAANLGNYTASFNVTLYYDNTEIGTQPVTDLGPSATRILVFTWDTTPIPKGNYTISAYAPPIIGENNIENNRLTDGWIKETILGDLNGDGEVNILDIFIVAKAFNSRTGDPAFEPNADLDNNGVINILDIFKIAKEFGKKDP